MRISDFDRVTELQHTRHDLFTRLVTLNSAGPDVNVSVSVNYEVHNNDGTNDKRFVQARVTPELAGSAVEMVRESLERRLVEVETELVELGVVLDI